MSVLRSTRYLRQATLRPIFFTGARAPSAPIQARFASQDYGSGSGDPVGGNPQQQGKNPSENLEHPGPPPPKVGQNASSSSPNEGKASSSPTSSNPTNQQQPNEPEKTPKSGASSKAQSGQSGSNDGAGVKGAQPKILNENPPTGDEESQDVKEHNREMDQRAERAHAQVDNKDTEKDKVNPKYWSGQGGKDRDP